MLLAPPKTMPRISWSRKKRKKLSVYHLKILESGAKMEILGEKK
jgi:hypothetical protein